MLRVIREVEPPTPSSRISTSETLASLAATRGVEPRRLSRLMRGDLDWVVMKALAKERERRSASSVGLADDLEKYLNHEPVSAGPPTATYRLRKFVRRNRVQVSAAVVVLVALVLGVVGTTLGLIEARRQEQIAIREIKEKEEAQRAQFDQRNIAWKRLQQVSKMNEILGSIFRDLDPARGAKYGKPLSAVLGERLDRASAEIEGEATGDPVTVARMQMTLGLSQLGLGYPERAMKLFTKARATYTTELGPDHPETLSSMNALANSYDAVGQNDRALKLREETLALTKAKRGPDHPDTLVSMNNLAISYYDAGQIDRAVAIRDEAIAACRKALGEGHRDTLRSRLDRAGLDLARNRLDAALAADRAIVDDCRTRLGPDDRLTIAAGLALARVTEAKGDRNAAAPLYRAALKSARKKPSDRETLSAALAE